MNDDDTIRTLLEAAVEGETAPDHARRGIEQGIGLREVVFGALELLFIVPAHIVSELVGGSGSAPTNTEGQTDE